MINLPLHYSNILYILGIGRHNKSAYCLVIYSVKLLSFDSANSIIRDNIPQTYGVY
jgi:hypothetical protein